MRKLFFGICLLGLLVNPVWAHQDGQETQVEVLARTSQSWNSGELTVITEDRQRLHLRAGEAIVEVVDTWHYGKNEGDEPAVIIVFYAGTKDRPITVKKTDKE